MKFRLLSLSQIISTQYRFFLRFCHKQAVYADRANTRLKSPVVRRFFPNEFLCHTPHDALHIAVQPPLKAMDCFWQTHCDETLIPRMELGLTKKLHCCSTWFSYIFLCFFPYPLSVVVAKVVSRRSHVTWRPLFKQARKYENTVLVLGYSWGTDQ